MTSHDRLVRFNAKQLSRCDPRPLTAEEIVARHLMRSHTRRGPSGPSQKVLERAARMKSKIQETLGDAETIKKAERNRKRREAAAAKRVAADLAANTADRLDMQP